MRKIAFLGALAGLLAVPAVAQAQVCLGIPSSDGQFALMGSVGFTDGAKIYGGSASADLVGPLSIGAGVSIMKADESDEEITGVQGVLAYDFAVTEAVVACPTVGVGYATFDTNFLGVQLDASQIVVPVGLGIGSTVHADAVGITLYAHPQFFWYRTTLEGSFEGETASETETDTDFGATVGVTLSSGPVFGGGNVAFDTAEGSEPVFTIGIGLLLGSGR